MDNAKQQLRKKMLQLRDQLPSKEISEKSETISKKLFELSGIKDAKTIAFYISKGSEVDTIKMIEQARTKRKKILVPVTNDEIELVEFTSFADLAQGQFGVLEPKTKIKSKCVPDVIIIPGLAFDLDLHRLGYGKGYYDRVLKKLSSFRVGLCYDFQLIDTIPKHEYDERVNCVVSESRILQI